METNGDCAIISDIYVIRGTLPRRLAVNVSYSFASGASGPLMPARTTPS